MIFWFSVGIAFAPFFFFFFNHNPVLFLGVVFIFIFFNCTDTTLLVFSVPDLRHNLGELRQGGRPL